MPIRRPKPIENTPDDVLSARAGDSALAGIEVDIADDIDALTADGPLEFEEGEDGAFKEALPKQLDAEENDFGANLVDVLEPAYVAKLGPDICRKVDRDIDDRKPWVDKYMCGMEQMGLLTAEMDDGPFPGASNAILPILAEAQINFWARALPELLPPEGPAKIKTVGMRSKDTDARAVRQADYLNWEMTVADKSYYSEKSRQIAMIPFQGCAFTKTYRDQLLNTTVGMFVPAEDLIVPSTASDLKSAPHFTHRYFRTKNEVRKMQVAGVFADIDLPDPLGNQDEIKDAKKDAEDQTSEHGDVELAPHELYEHYVSLDLPGFEDEQDGEPTGIQLEYVVTVDRDSEKVLSIYRNWRPDDKLRARRVFFTKYDYLPGQGFYGYGLFHYLGSLQDAATGALRSMLDAAAMASLQGGFIAKDANLKNQRLVVEPGVYQPIESTAEEFSKAFLTPPYKEPSAALFQLIGLLTEAGQRFTSTTEAMVGEGAQNAPVGTTMALIEQGHKVYSAIHRGLHASMADELEIRVQLARENIPEEGYPYDPDGKASRTVYASDFAPGVQCVPVSDPNIFSNMQRLQQAQGVMQLADTHPDIIDRKVATKRMLEAMKVADIDELMSVTQDPQPMDPVSENAGFLRQMPVKAFPEQDHMAHIQVHMAFAQHPGFGAHPEVGPMIMPVMQAHIGEHLGYLYQQYARQGGIPVPMIDPKTGQPGQPQVPPEQIAQMAAQLSPMLAHMPGLPPTQQPGGEGEQSSAMQDAEKAKGIQAQSQAKQQSMQQESQAKIAIMTQEAQAKAQIRAQEGAQKLAEKQAEMEMKQKDREHEAGMKQMARAVDIQNQQVDAQHARQQRATEHAEAQRQRAIDHAQSVEQRQADHDQSAQQTMQNAAMDMQQRHQSAQMDAQQRQDQAAHDKAMSAAKVKQARQAKPKPKGDA